MDKSMFKRKLSNFKRLWQAGLLAVIALRLLMLAVAMPAIYAALDFLIAFESGTLLAIGLSMAGVLLLTGLHLTAGVLKLKDRDAALRADALLGDRRRPILSALELSAWVEQAPEDGRGFGGFLAEMEVEEAGKSLSTLTTGQTLPTPEIKRHLKALAALLLATGTLALCFGDIAKTVIPRLLLPFEDIPPYSRYVFAVSPDSPETLYGGDQPLSVHITGAPVKEQVWLVTRNRQGRSYRTACFQENGSKYAQRLERMTQPLEFCFATGRARSKWRKAGIIYQPVVALASVKVFPPAYSGLPVRQFFAGNEELSGLRDSLVELSVTSNRELLDGELSPPAPGMAPDQAQRVKGEKTGPRTLRFSWRLREQGKAQVMIRDIRGAPAKEPYAIAQKLLPDRPPEVSLIDPPEFSMATPSSVIPVNGRAEDDLGLRSAGIVKSLAGYRDRLKAIEVPRGSGRGFEFNETLDLRSVGVEPGQTLEFYVEAADGNPDLTGISSSSIARVLIISEDDYALMLRVKAGVEDFSRNFNAASARIEEAKRSMKELQDLLSSGGKDVKAIEAQLGKTAKRLTDAADIFDRMANDFPLYDLEKGFLHELQESATKFRLCGDTLAALKPDAPELRATADAIAKTLRAGAAPLERYVADAKELETVAGILKCRIRFERLISVQETFVRRLQRLEGETHFRNLKMLANSGKTQEDIRKDLLTLLSDIESRTAKLAPEDEALKAQALFIADGVKRLEIAALMEKSSVQAMNSNGSQALNSATLALEHMRSLLKESACDSEGNRKGDGRQGFNMKDSLKSTLKQMLAALKCMGRQGAGGNGFGGGTGGGGDMSGAAGLSGGGAGGMNSPLDVPLFGPSRSAPGGSSTELCPTGPGEKARITKNSAETMNHAPSRKAESQERGIPLESIPAKYREAVKRYFTEEAQP